jgi:hypothetical protein
MIDATTSQSPNRFSSPLPGLFQSAVSAIASQASYCARAALIPLWLARDLK